MRNIPEAYLPNVYQFFKSQGLEVDVPAIVNSITSCTGADTCRLGICLPKGAVKALRRRLLKSDLELDKIPALEINLNGCSNGCAQNAWTDLGFSGRIGRVEDHPYPAYAVWLRVNGNRQLAEGQGYVSAHDLPAFVEDYLRVAIEKQSQYNTYDDFVKTEGSDVCKCLIAKYKNVPPFDEDKNYYYDWGAKEKFSLTSHGQAECSAGLFDIIEIDQDTIKEKRKALEKANSGTEQAALLHDIAFSSSRMLLVTRGADPRTDDDVYDNFVKLFIEAGIVDAKFKAVVEKARKNEPLTEEKEEVLQLSDAVMELYSGMDDSLQFKVKAQPATEERTAPESNRQGDENTGLSPHVVKDFRGVGCPMNFVKTKIALAPLSSGSLLEIWLDDGQPISNVPGSVRQEGHEVLLTEKVDNYWRVLIRKK